jgi:hypothetical protein
MHLCNRWGTSEIKIFCGSDYAHIGSVKLLEDADSPIAYGNIQKLGGRHILEHCSRPLWRLFLFRAGAAVIYDVVF